MLRLLIFLLPFIFLFSSACSTPSWFPKKPSWLVIKKGPPHQAKMKELVDKEVIIIDGEEYVKVSNPKALEGRDNPRYLYISVHEYLSQKETFIPSMTTIASKGVSKEEFPISARKPSSPLIETEVSLTTSLVPTLPDLKKKVMVTYFNDRTTSGDEAFGDWVAEKLVKEVNRRSQRILFVDYQMVKEFIEKKGFILTDLETPKVLQLLNEVFGIHVLVVGQLLGPYVFTTKAVRDQDKMASAIIKIETKLVDTFSGKFFKNLSASNPILATNEKGSFSEEKAKLRAIDFTIADLSRSLSRELEGLDWFCRIVKVDGEEVYINAGKLTGLRVGDVMEVFQTKELGDRGELKGKVQIMAFLGIDASMGKLINGEKPNVNDILKRVKSN